MTFSTINCQKLFYRCVQVYLKIKKRIFLFINMNWINSLSMNKRINDWIK